MPTSFEATIVDGRIAIPSDLHLPELARVVVTIAEAAPSTSGRIFSPRLSDPSQAADFCMDVAESPHAGV